MHDMVVAYLSAPASSLGTTAGPAAAVTTPDSAASDAACPLSART